MSLNAQGAATGAAGGAALGTAVFPGIGTAIGGVLGGLGGAFKAQPEPEDPMIALTGFTTQQVLVGASFGALVLYLAVR